MRKRRIRPGRGRTAALALLALAAILPARGQGLNPDPPGRPVKLIFIHHSTGEAWLADDQGGLAIALMNNNYYVSDTNYGWGPGAIGDLTDIGHWYNWFLGPDRDVTTDALFKESGNNSGYTRMEEDPGEENEVILFKSCFPNSSILGHPGDAPLPAGQPNPICGQCCCGADYTVANVKGLYRDLLDYFASRPDKLFILIVTPPLIPESTSTSEAANARAVADWLVNGWLSGYTAGNVRAFDYYNVLTSNGGNRNTNDAGWEAGNHHRYWNSQVQHLQTVSCNTSAYGSSASDSHPTAAGQRKAKVEFVPLLNIWFNGWSSGLPVTLTVTRPVAAELVFTGSTITVTWEKSGAQDAGVSLRLLKGAAEVLEISPGTENDGSFAWDVPRYLPTAFSYRIRVTTLDGQVSGDGPAFTLLRLPGGAR
jgi:hypothetical protein